MLKERTSDTLIGRGYFSDASKNLHIHKISPVSSWIRRLVFQWQIKFIIRPAGPMTKQETLPKGVGVQNVTAFNHLNYVSLYHLYLYLYSTLK